MKELRMRVLQHIVKTRFKEKYGDEWWDKLLLHMRESASDPASMSGKKYGLILKRAGRKITFENLDTSVLSTIILFDDYYKYGANAITYSQYELDLARKLHAIRNTISHDESGSNDKNLEKATLQLLRDAVDELNMLENNQQLASDILEAYAANFGLRKNDANAKDLIARTKRFKEAEDLFKWNVEQAIPIYEELANEGFKGAQERLLWIYTHTVRNFDLEKASALCDTYPNLLQESDIKTLKELAGMVPHVIWGTAQACEIFGLELDKKQLIENDAILKYIRWIRSAFPGGLLHWNLWNGARNTELDLFRAMASKCPDINSLKARASSGGEKKSPTAVYAELLLWLADKRKFDPVFTQKSLEKFAETGYQPLISYFEKSGNKNFAKGTKSETGKESSNSESNKDESEMNSGSGAKVSQEKEHIAMLQAEIIQLQTDNKRLKMSLYICASTAAISIIVAFILAIT